MRRLARALVWLGGGLLALVAAGLRAWFGGLGPWGPYPGGILWGEVAREPVPDWSFVDRVGEVQVQTRLGPLPWSVTTWALTHEGQLYLPSRNCFETRWVKNLLERPHVRVRVEGRFHELRAVRDEDPALGGGPLAADARQVPRDRGGGSAVSGGRAGRSGDARLRLRLPHGAGLVRGARPALAALGLAALACDLGPFGGSSLRGERVSGPVADWSFAAERYAIEIETVAPALLPSATTWFVVHEGPLWLYTMLPPPIETPWVRRLREEDPGVRIRLDGRLYPGRAVWVQDPVLLEPLLPVVLRKYHLVETPRARFVAAPERHPGTQIRHIFFRVDPP